MAENTEKKVLIDVKILDNFIASKKNADYENNIDLHIF